MASIGDDSAFISLGAIRVMVLAIDGSIVVNTLFARCLCPLDQTGLAHLVAVAIGLVAPREVLSWLKLTSELTLWL
jgi:hypothetical protein